LSSEQLIALQLLLSFDNLIINKQSYVKKAGNIEVDWDEKYEFGKFKVELYPKEQYLEKVS